MSSSHSESRAAELQRHIWQLSNVPAFRSVETRLATSSRFPRAQSVSSTSPILFERRRAASAADLQTLLSGNRGVALRRALLQQEHRHFPYPLRAQKSSHNESRTEQTSKPVFCPRLCLSCVSCVVRQTESCVCGSGSISNNEARLLPQRFFGLVCLSCRAGAAPRRLPSRVA